MNEDSMYPARDPDSAGPDAALPRDTQEPERADSPTSDSDSAEPKQALLHSAEEANDHHASPSEPKEGTARSASAPPTHSGLDDGQYRHPSPMHLRLERIGGLIGLLVLSLIGGTIVSVLWFVGPLEGGFRFIPVLAFLLLLVWSAFMGIQWPKVSHRHRRYRLDPESIEIQKGVFWRSAVSVPCSRVQHADVAQGPLERRLGLATLTLHTAGTEHASVVLDGIEYERALALRDHLVGAADRIRS